MRETASCISTVTASSSLSTLAVCANLMLPVNAGRRVKHRLQAAASQPGMGHSVTLTPSENDHIQKLSTFIVLLITIEYRSLCTQEMVISSNLAAIRI